MDWVGVAALITAVAGGLVSLLTVYIQLRSRIDKARHDTHAEIIRNYQDLLARSNAHAEVFLKEIGDARNEGKQAQEEARDFFASQLREVTQGFSMILKEERMAARTAAEENRKAMAVLAGQNAEEHKAIIASIEELRNRIDDVVVK